MNHSRVVFTPVTRAPNILVFMDMITPEPRPCWIAGRAERGASTIVVSHH